MFIINRSSIALEDYSDILVLDTYKAEFIYILSAISKYIEFSYVFNKNQKQIYPDKEKSLDWFFRSFDISIDRDKDKYSNGKYKAIEIAIDLLSPKNNSLEKFTEDVIISSRNSGSVYSYQVFNIWIVLYENDDSNHFNDTNKVLLDGIDSHNPFINNVVTLIDYIVTKLYTMLDPKFISLRVGVFKYGEWCKLFNSSIEYFIEDQNKLKKIQIIEDEHWCNTARELLNELDEDNIKINKILR